MREKYEARLKSWRQTLSSVASPPTTANSTAADEAEARKLSEQALRLAKTPDRLTQAVELMEKAFQKSPELREKYGYQLGLWRKGVLM